MCYVNYTSKTFMMQNRVYLKNGGWWRRHRCRQVQRGIVCIFVYAAWASAGQAVQTLCQNASECRNSYYESWQSTVQMMKSPTVSACQCSFSDYHPAMQKRKRDREHLDRANRKGASLCAGRFGNESTGNGSVLCCVWAGNNSIVCSRL